jgi:hypothetical protein
MSDYQLPEKDSLPLTELIELWTAQNYSAPMELTGIKVLLYIDCQDRIFRAVHLSLATSAFHVISLDELR